jgi:hypothetical protein
VYYFNDLWEFNPSTNEWAWMGGSSAVPSVCPASPSNCGQPGAYGTLGTPAAGNVPGGRSGSSNWTDSNGNLWLFGGTGFDANDDFGTLNDLWEFNPSTNEWIWISGSNSVGANGGQPGVYGTLGEPAPANVPGASSGASSWTDSGGNLWLFANNGPNALWKFDPSIKEWAWMGGNSTINANGDPGIYGSIGVPAAGNMPGGRSGASNWVDRSGNFWLFGGGGAGGADLNDLWEFSPATNEWAWMAGRSTLNCFGETIVDCAGWPGVYGTLGAPAVANIPGGRQGALSWVDGSGHFWLLGGFGTDGAGDNYIYLNDLWEFDPSTNEWTWMSGSSTAPALTGVPGVYGTLGTPAAGNTPSGRESGSSWVDSSGHLWLFGGEGNIVIGNIGLFVFSNDLWAYEPSPSASAATPAFSLVAGTYTAAQTVTISDATTGAAIYFTTNGSAPTTSSALYSGSITISSTETLKAVAVAPGVLSSALASATYTINLPPDFAVAAAPVSMTVTAGSSGAATISIAPQGGFASAVSFACSGLPAGASCGFSPSTLTPPGTTQTSVTVTTSSASARLRRRTNSLFPEATLAVTLCCFGWKKRRGLHFLLMLTVSMAGLGLLSGCGSSSGAGSSGSQSVTSTVTVTATSGSLVHTTTFTLTVN